MATRTIGGVTASENELAILSCVVSVRSQAQRCDLLYLSAPYSFFQSLAFTARRKIAYRKPTELNLLFNGFVGAPTARHACVNGKPWAAANSGTGD